MKKNKKLAIDKESKKLAKKELEGQIVGALQSITGKLDNNQKKINKLITKSAKQLSRKLVKEIMFRDSATEASAVFIDKAVKKRVAKVKAEAKKEEVPA